MTNTFKQAASELLGRRVAGTKAPLLMRHNAQKHSTMHCKSNHQ
ncbi:hypothetical protein JCM19235_3563 [Vibrio maritimus]|uniref:Uncharacterized protein n=1 Tax=Vibrio maritimus TaxID=990268 RepID=A0A090RZ57_9VIBR|nr:hypothetical protein JCM19235_3563 [Vibrio maritimus]